MIGPMRKTLWAGLVCDATSATLYAVRGGGAAASLEAVRHVEFEPQKLHQDGRLPALDQFVSEHRLSTCAAYVAFAGAGTIVQRLHMPPLSARNRNGAIRTRLSSYAGGAELAVGVLLDGRPSRRDGVHLLAAGVDSALSRGIFQACQRAGLRVRVMTALASACNAPSDAAAVVQLLLGEHRTTIQVFETGRLMACRDVLIGRRDFVTAYQRPILTEGGAVSLSAEEAEALCRSVGVPAGREGEIRPGVSAAQVWPTLSPVLEKLRHEVEQSLRHSQLGDAADIGISVLGVPSLPGLGECLATEMQLRGTLAASDRPEADYLAALAESAPAPDLRPVEVRFADRMARPALAAGLCALMVIGANLAAPQEAHARRGELRPQAEQLHEQLACTQVQREAAELALAELAAETGRDLQLARALPANVPVAGPLKVVFGSVPAGMQLVDVRIDGSACPVTLQVRAGYQGEVAASVAAAQWARVLAESPLFSNVRVAQVSGSGRASSSVVEIEAVCEGG